MALKHITTVRLIRQGVHKTPRNPVSRRVSRRTQTALQSVHRSLIPSQGLAKSLAPAAFAEIETCPVAIPIAWAFAPPPFPANLLKAFAWNPVFPPLPPVAEDETDAPGTPITIAFDVALPPAPPLPTGRPSMLVLPPAPPIALAAAKPAPMPLAVLVAAVAPALPPDPPLPPGFPPLPPVPPVALAVLLRSLLGGVAAVAAAPGPPSVPGYGAGGESNPWVPGAPDKSRTTAWVGNAKAEPTDNANITLDKYRISSPPEEGPSHSHAMVESMAPHQIVTRKSGAAFICQKFGREGAVGPIVEVFTLEPASLFVWIKDPRP
jgi:hypothetical protein